jgi:DNA polymerase (family 10)
MIIKTIAEIFRDTAKLLEIKGENVFRIRAYERAAQNIESLSEDIQDLLNEGRLTSIPGIGPDLERKIKEIVKTGKLKFFADLKKTVPEGLLELLKIPSVGPKTAKLFYEKLKVKSVPELQKAATEGRLLGLEGIKEKTVENILKGIALLKRGRERMDLASAISTANELIKSLKSKLQGLKQISSCGSLRRMKETVRDIDILAVSDSAKEVMDAFTRLPQVKDITAQGSTKSSIITREGAQVDLRVVKAKSYGAALLYFTGSKNFNIKIRQLAIRKGLKVNEYGVFSLKGGREVYRCGKTEEEVFKSLGLARIEPELREDSGEIELAAKNKLPDLITLGDIRGDLHSHSRYSDGNNSILEMAQGAQRLGYEYLNISDHSQGLRVARGLSLEDLKKKRSEVDKLNLSLKNFKILFGSEVDIDSLGKLDYPDQVLAEFDVVVAAIHSGFKQSKGGLTKRLVYACKNKNVDILAHPTGRLWGTRDSYEIDFDQVFKAASDYGIALEINAYPLRLDLSGVNCRRAKERGIRMAISTDAHTTGQLQYVHLGVATARRGWLTKDDVLNTLSYEELMKIFKK